MQRFSSLITFSFLLALSACLPQTVGFSPTPTSSALPSETSRPPTSTPKPTATSTPIPDRALQRGVNLGNMLEAPKEGDWGLTVRDEYFDLIKQAGFDFVRLPVRWFAHTKHMGHDDGDTTYVIDSSFFARIDEVVGWALKRNLKIIVDFHHYDELMANPNEEQFLFMWRQIAEHYQDYPPQVMFELLNEPTDKITAPLWNIYLHDALMVIRESNPTRDVIFGPANWNAFNWVNTLDVPDDPHIIVTFHYYEPFQFTHQGAEWVAGSYPWLGITWNATDAEKAEITRNFDSVADWAQRNGNVRILLGEFGAYSKVDMASRVRWTSYVAREAERHGFAWAYWEFASGFGIYNPYAKVWKKDLLKALIP